MEHQTSINQIEALQERLTRLTLMQAAFQPKLRRRWIRFIIRESLTVLLYIIFWKYEWVRLSLYVVAPLVLLNLGILSLLTWALPRKIAILQKCIEQQKS